MIKDKNNEKRITAKAKAKELVKEQLYCLQVRAIDQGMSDEEFSNLSLKEENDLRNEIEKVVNEFLKQVNGGQ